MYFLDKRDKNGMLLSYSAYELAYRIADHCFKKTEKTEIYKVLNSCFQNENLEVFFKKLYYIESKSLAHRIVLNNWEVENNTNHNSKKFNIKLFPVEGYLEDFLVSNNIKFEKKIDKKFLKIKLSSIVSEIRYFFKKKMLSYLFHKKKNNKVNKESIAICYSEGINLDKRSDLFWLEDSKINPDDIILYFENYKAMTRFEKKEDLFKKIEKFKIKTEKLWKCVDNSEVNFLREIKMQLKKLNISTPEEKSLLKISLQLIEKTKFYYLFFKKINAKIHIDKPDMDIENIIKLLALGKFDGCSVGKLRSAVGENSYDFIGYFSNDILFIPSKDSHHRLKNHSFSKFQYSIITGYPYKLFTDNNKIEINKIRKFFDNHNKKFIVLLLDGAYSQNKSDERQIITKDCVFNYFNTILDTLTNVDDIGIIIKSKRISELEQLDKIYSKALDLEKKGACYIVKDPFQKMPALYASISNLVIGTSFFYPSALIESILKNKLGVFCDFANLKPIEKNWYEWGKNKVIFNDVVELSRKIIDYKNDKEKNKYFGDWSSQKDILDSYQDDLGHKRIGKYLISLLQSFKNKASRSEAILMANKDFSKTWGEDKVLKY